MMTTSRRNLVLWLSTLCVLLYTSSLRAQKAPELWVGQTDHYLVHTNLTANEVRPWATHMDSVYRGFTQMLRGFPKHNGDEKQSLYLLRTHQDYLSVLQNLGIDGTGSDGMFFVTRGKTGLITHVDQHRPEAVKGVLQHEGFHQFAYNRIGTQIPIWVNEGLAEYFEQAIVINGRIYHGLANRYRVNAIKNALATNQVIPFDQMLDLTGERWLANVRHRHNNAQLQYLQSWSIVHFLIHGDNAKYQQTFDRYLRALANSTPHASAFAAAFGTTDRDAFRARWEAFTRETLQVDPYNQASDRLDFLAQCTKDLLKDRRLQNRVVPGNLFDLLKSRGYEIRPRTASPQNPPPPPLMTTRDQDVFTYTNDRGFKQNFKLRVNGDRRLPPIISAEGLTPTPRVVWSVNNGVLTHTVSFDQ